MKTFFGLPLNQTDALSNIGLMVETGMLLYSTANNELIEVGETILGIARDYSVTASNPPTNRNISISSIIGSPTPETTSGKNTNLPHASTIGERIRELRKQRGMTCDDLANALNVSVMCISAWEGGFTIPACNKAVPLAKALNCDPMWLLTGEPVEIVEES